MIDLHRLLVYSHIKMIVIVSLLFAFLQDKELNRMSIEASASGTQRKSKSKSRSGTNENGFLIFQKQKSLSKCSKLKTEMEIASLNYWGANNFSKFSK